MDITQNLSYQLLLLSNTLGRSAARELMALADISVPEWRIISVVGTRGPMSLNDLAQTIAIDKAWVSRTLGPLERRGFIVRNAQPKDARQFLLSLTEAGEAIHLKVSDVSTKRQKRLKSHFSAKEYEMFEGFLMRLQAAAEEMLEQPVDSFASNSAV